MTSSDGKSWNRDVHVYPKNSMATVKKSVQDDKKNAEVEGRKGEKTVTYTLDGVVPATPENHTFEEFKLNDSYNNTELRLEAGYLQSVEVVRGGEVVETLKVGADNDYTVTEGESTAAENSEGKDYNAGFVIALTKTGRGKVQANDHVVAKVKATLLNNNTVTGQDVWNDVFASGKFTRVPGTGEGFEPKEWETPHDEVVTYLGNIEVFKTGENGDKTEPLKGAEFKLYRCNDADNVIQTGTTDADGLLKFEGLHVTNYRNNEEPPAEEVYKYCIKETKAPAGYSKDPNEHKITLTKDDRKKRDDKGAYVANKAEGALRMNGVSVNNIKSSVPTLPSTGGMGVLIIVLAGLAIIGGGVYAARRNSQAA